MAANEYAGAARPPVTNEALALGLYLRAVCASVLTAAAGLVAVFTDGAAGVPGLALLFGGTALALLAGTRLRTLMNEPSAGQQNSPSSTQSRAATA